MFIRVHPRNELGATACGCILRACCPNGTERGSATRSSPECRMGAGNSMGFRTVERAAAHRAALRRHRNRFEQHALDTVTKQLRANGNADFQIGRCCGHERAGDAESEFGAPGAVSRACCPNGTERGSATRSSPECRMSAGNSMGFRAVEHAAAHRAALRRRRNRFGQHALDTRIERKLLPLPAKRGEISPNGFAL